MHGRPADRYERAALVTYLTAKPEKKQGAPAEDDPDDDEGGAGASPEQQLQLARAAAFVDLTHTIANSNEFSYRF